MTVAPRARARRPDARTAPRAPLALALLALLVACEAASEAPAEPPRLAAPPAVARDAAAAPATGAAPELNETFLDPQLDVDSFVERFEGESREIAAAREGLLAALDLQPGDRVADIGAGTGLFLVPFSRAVGPEGMVYAVDIAPRFVEHLGERARAESLGNVRVVQCDARSTGLPPASVDTAFVCDTYHHFEHPAETLASLRRALRPGGKLVVVDFERIPGTSREWLLDHVRAGKDVFAAEIRAAGFTGPEELAVDGLEENYVLVFRKPAS